MKSITVVALIALFLLAGCSGSQLVTTQAPQATSTPAQKPEQAGQDIEVVFTKSGGIAGVDERWSISTDGRITTSDGTTGQVSVAELSAIADKLQKLGFFELKSSYIPLDTCCDRFTYQLEVTIGGKAHTVTALQGEPGTPDEFWQALELISGLMANVK